MQTPAWSCIPTTLHSATSAVSQTKCSPAPRCRISTPHYCASLCSVGSASPHTELLVGDLPWYGTENHNCAMRLDLQLRAKSCVWLNHKAYVGGWRWIRCRQGFSYREIGVSHIGGGGGTARDMVLTWHAAVIGDISSFTFKLGRLYERYM